MAPRLNPEPRGPHVPFPPMPSAWREPAAGPPLDVATPRPPTLGRQDYPDPTVVPAQMPDLTGADPVTPARATPARSTPDPVSPIAYPGLPTSAPAGYDRPAWTAAGYAAHAHGRPTPARPPFPGAVSSRSSLVAGLLQIFLGGFAAGRFYTGHIGLAITQLAVVWGGFLVVACLGAATLAPMLMVFGGLLWPFVDGIVLLTGGQLDRDGRPLR